jgi:hypothetical protein
MLHYHLKHSPFILELHLTFGGMHIDIDEMRGDREKHDADRKAASGQEFTVPSA